MTSFLVRKVPIRWMVARRSISCWAATARIVFLAAMETISSLVRMMPIRWMAA
jgi:hypothetical protein